MVGMGVGAGLLRRGQMRSAVGAAVRRNPPSSCPAPPVDPGDRARRRSSFDCRRTGEGPIMWWAAGGVFSTGLAIAGRRQGNSGRSAVIRPHSIAWAMDGNNLVTAFRDAKLIGKEEGLAVVQRPKRDGAGWATVVDLPASRKASTAITKREDLASALAMDEVQLMTERVRGKSGH